jgi:valyl-tRNA synthetase
MNVAGKDVGLEGPKPSLTFVDRWIISRLQHAEREIGRQLEEYRFDLAAKALYEFVWDEYCDWYVELAKVQLADPSEDVQRGTRRTLLRVLEAVLRLAHPFIPFITEELWQHVAPLAGKSGETIMLQPYPQAQDENLDPKASLQVDTLKHIVDAVRSLRSEMNLAPGEKADLLIAGDVRSSGAAAFASFVKALSRLSDYRVVDELPKSNAPVQIVDKLQLMLDVKIDPAVERERIAKQLAQLASDIARAEAKLRNEGFVNRAPAPVVEQERARLAGFRATHEQLTTRLSGLAPT